MGLLDFNFQDPKQAGLLALAQGLFAAGAPQSRKVGLGEALTGGLSNMANAQQLARDQQMKSQNDAMGLEMNRMHLDQNKSNILAKQKAAEFQAQIPQIINQFGNDYQGMIKAGVPQELVKSIAESANYGRSKVARTLDVEGEGGAKITRQFDEYGNSVGGDVNAYVAPISTNLLDRVVIHKPMAGQSFNVGMSPSQRDNSAQGWAGIGIQKERLANDKLKDSQVDGYSTKPLPTAALKMQNEAVDAIGTAGGINKMLSGVEKQIADGKVTFGPISNMKNQALNAAGMSTEGSRNFSSFKSNLEKIRNESLRLNSGVQTDGDAQRAWNELFQNINDTDLVKQRLGEIKALNNRAVDLQKLKVDGIRSNYKAEPFDYGKLPDAVPKASMRFNTSTGKLERVE